MTKNITLAAISQACGVSHITASRALRGMRNVKPETAKRIRDYADSIGYKPSRTARSLAFRRNGEFSLVGQSIVAPYNEESMNRDSNFLFWDCLEGAVSAAATKKSSIEVMGFENGAMEFDFIRALVESERVAGLLDFGLRSETIDYLISRKVPVVSRLKAVHGLANRQNPAVYSDHIQGYFLAWRHFQDFGHQRIGFIGGPGHHAHLKECNAAAFLTTPASKLEKEIWIGEVNNVGSIGATLLAELGPWSAETWPSAFFCANDEVAQFVVLALKEIGLSVPEQISIIGFDDSHFARFCTPPLTTLRNPRREIGAAMFHLLFDLIEASSATHDRTKVIAMELMVRASVQKQSRSPRSEKSKTTRRTALA